MKNLSLSVDFSSTHISRIPPPRLMMEGCALLAIVNNDSFCSSSLAFTSSSVSGERIIAISPIISRFSCNVVAPPAKLINFEA